LAILFTYCGPLNWDENHTMHPHTENFFREFGDLRKAAGESAWLVAAARGAR
jgi:hypothetical protein